ncbi:MAG: hypothetical protein QF811_06030 [Candidatus Woesearchaeota archaeon]|jgi:hypothetical protein|nr:hypothetical protein [Candidatus Woesearchaeota archaeon]
MDKGQATLFVILGAILLITIASAAYFVNQRQVQLVEGELPTLQEAPAVAQPVVAYYQTCIRQVGRDALRLVGLHGGYTSPQQLRANSFDPTGTDNDAVHMFPDTDLVAAYWHYLKSPNNCEKLGECVYDSKRPNLRGRNSIQSELEKYVTANLPSCLQDFPIDGIVVKQDDDISTRVTLTKKNVQFLVNHDLVIKRGGESFKRDQFLYVENLNLVDIYELATEITNLERQFSYLEKMTKELISAFSGRESDRLPPISDFEVALAAPRFWTKFNSERIFRDVLGTHASLFQVLNTRDYAPIIAPAAVADPELFDVIYNRMFIVPVQTEYPDLTADFVYLDWKPYFDINCPGQVCRPEGFVANFLPIPFGFHRTKFFYDVSYPLMVELSDPDAFNGQGYSFRFFMEANMRNNLPLNSEYVELADPGLPQPSEYCDPTRWHTPGKFTIKDGFTGRVVEDAAISFSCPPEVCILGSSNDEGEFKGNVPSCIGGTATVLHPEYASVSQAVDSNLPFEETIEFFPYVNVDFELEKLLIRKTGSNFFLDVINPAPLRPYEKAVVLLTRKAESNEPAFTAVAEIQGDPFKPSQNKDIRLVPGTYEVRIIATASPDPAWVIPPRERCFDAGFFDEECVLLPDEEIRFDKDQPFPTGDHSMEWELTPEDLKGAKTIRFRYVSYELSPNNDNALESLDKINLPAELTKQATTQEKLEPVIFSG